MGQRKNREFFSELMVGLFMVVVLGLLAYFTIVISGVDLLTGRSEFPVQVVFENVGGLKASDSVVMRGMTVGSVEKLALSQGKVNVTLALREDVKLREGYRFSVCTGSLLGGNYLLIEEGEGKPLPAGTRLVGTTPKRWMEDLGDVIADLKQATSGGELKSIVTNLNATVASFKVVAERIEKGRGTLGKLLSEDMTVYNDLEKTMANLRSLTDKIDSGTNTLATLLNDDGRVYGSLRKTIANLETVSSRLEKGKGTLGKLLSEDDTVYQDLQETVASLKRVAVRLDKAEGSLGKLMKDDNKVYNDLEKTVANLRSVTDRLEKGEGTLGKLSADDELYDDIHGLVKDVRQTVDNFRDTTPITAFSSLIMGGL